MPTPPPPVETQFKPGQSGNPGGLTKAMRAQIDANAAEAVRIRSALLAKVAAHIDPETGVFMGDLDGDTLKLVKDSEDRGLGAPKQTTEHEGNLNVTSIERVVIDPKAAD